MSDEFRHDCVLGNAARGEFGQDDLALRGSLGSKNTHIGELTISQSRLDQDITVSSCGDHHGYPVWTLREEIDQTADTYRLVLTLDGVVQKVLFDEGRR